MDDAADARPLNRPLLSWMARMLIVDRTAACRRPRVLVAPLVALAVVALLAAIVSRVLNPPPAPGRLVVLGDSVATGTACDCPAFGATVASQRAETLTNDAVDGLTSADLLAQLAGPAVGTDLRGAAAVVLVVGANDFDANRAGDPGCADLACWADARAVLALNLDRILTRVSALVPAGAPVVVTGYGNVFLDGAAGAARGPTYVAISDALTRSINTVLASAAAAHADRYADGYAALKGDGRRDDSALLTPDGDHPDAAGHLALAAAVQRALRP